MKAMGLENEYFSDEDQYECMYTWEFFEYIFFGILKTPTRKIYTNQTLPGESSLKHSHQEYFHPCF